MHNPLFQNTGPLFPLTVMKIKLTYVNLLTTVLHLVQQLLYALQSWMTSLGNYVFNTKYDRSITLKHCPSVLDYEAANAVIVILDSLHTCSGNPDSNFVHMCYLRNWQFVSTNWTIRAYKDEYCPITLDGEVYSATVWTTNYELLTTTYRCDQCKSYRPILRAMHSHQQRTTELIGVRYQATPISGI